MVKCCEKWKVVDGFEVCPTHGMTFDELIDSNLKKK